MSTAQIRRPPATPQGEPAALWALWVLFLAAIFVTYTRIDPSELYHVSHDGLAGGASRVLVETNFPIAMFAVATALIAMDALGSRWWRLGAPTIAACAVMAWPGVVDDGDLDARLVNAVPAFGVAGAVALTVAAGRRSSFDPAPRQPFDRGRVGLSALVLFFSLPWIFAVAGVNLPEAGFITTREITGSDGVVSPAVHLGDHHGFNGAQLLIAAIWLSRVQLGSRTVRAVTRGYLSLLGAYGAVNFVQDLTHEQLYKRDWVSWRIPNASKPTLTPVWLVIFALAIAAFALVTREARVPNDTSRHG
jgi:hypothetical protein